MDCSTPGSSVHTILQARILEQVSISFSRGSSNPGIKLASPALQADSLPSDLAKPLHFSLSAWHQIKYFLSPEFLISSHFTLVQVAISFSLNFWGSFLSTCPASFCLLVMLFPYSIQERELLTNINLIEHVWVKDEINHFHIKGQILFGSFRILQQIRRGIEREPRCPESQSRAPEGRSH